MFDFELPSNYCSMKVLLGTYYKTACIVSTRNIIFYSRKVIASCWHGSYKNKRGRCNLRKTVLFLVHKIIHSTIFQTRTLDQDTRTVIQGQVNKDGHYAKDIEKIKLSFLVNLKYFLFVQSQTLQKNIPEQAMGVLLASRYTSQW